MNKIIKNWRLFLIGILLFLSVVIFFLSNFPRWTSFCGTCHATRIEYATWQKSSHSIIGCRSCHYGKGIGGFVAMELKGFRNFMRWVTFQSKPPILASVDDRPCRNCHSRLEKRIVESNLIRMKHKEVMKAGWKCTNCHGSVGHQLRIAETKRATMDKCFTCHDGKVAVSTCTSCHLSETNFTPERKRTSGALAHLANWEKIHGLTDPSSCSNCHESEFCKRCHNTKVFHLRDWPFLHGRVAKDESPKVCKRCHSQKFCFACHQISLPHPSKWSLKHSKGAKIKGKGVSLCQRCHIKENCQECHLKHGLPPL